MATQREVLDYVLSGKQDAPVLITAGAGRGKSYLLRQITQELGSSVVVGAPTGIAALNVGGETLHSLFGLPTTLVTREDKEKISGKARKILKTADVLAVDEVAMCRADYLDLIDHKLKVIRKNKQPFGGIKFIGIGDFFQLAPVLAPNEQKHFIYDSPFCFDSDVWKESNFRVFELLKCYRQDQPRQVKILDSIRQKDVNYLRAIAEINKMSDEAEVNGEECTTLTSYKADSDMINNYHYRKVVGEEMCYPAEVKGKFFERPVEENLKLKAGVRVLICSNDFNGQYKNGETGVVLDTQEDFVRVLKSDGVEVIVEPAIWDKYSYTSSRDGLSKQVTGSYRQIPLRLGWASTIHKQQGSTLDNVHLDLGNSVFSHGQAYVAVSRVRDLRKMSLARPMTSDDVIVNDAVIKFYESIRRGEQYEK